MQWEEFYDKARYDWSPSTTTSRLSRLESLGSAEEVADLVEYYMDEAGMVRLINKAMSADIVFTGEQIANMAACLDEEHADRLQRRLVKRRTRTISGPGQARPCSLMTRSIGSWERRKSEYWETKDAG